MEYDFFANIKKSGIIAIKLEKEDKLQWALLTDGDNNVIVITHLGKAILFSEKDVRPMGRSSKGVIGIRLNKEDFVTSMDACPKTSLDRDLIVIGARGVGKKTSLKLFPRQRRGGKGAKATTVDSKTGKIVFSAIIEQDRETLVITSLKGQVVKIPLKDVPRLSRTAKGVILMRFAKDDAVASATFL